MHDEKHCAGADETCTSFGTGLSYVFSFSKTGLYGDIKLVEYDRDLSALR